MSSSVQGPQGALSLEIYTKKIHSVFDMHRVEFGAPEDLPPFLKRLREDRHLAMDFWALAAAISTSEGGDLPNDQMLEIIVHGVTGKDPAELRQSGDDEMKRTLDDLGHLLAGVDLDSPPEEDGLPVTEQDTWPPDSNKQQPLSVSSRIKAVPPIEKPAEPVFDVPIGKDPSAEDHAINTAPAGAQVNAPAEKHVKDGALSERVLDEALSRLEMNSHNLRLHLENIDSRMSRIEPHLQELTFKVASSPADVAQAPGSADPQSIGTQTNGARSEDRIQAGIKSRNEDRIEDRNQARTLDTSASPPARSHRANPKSNPRLVLLTDDDDDPSIRVPLSGYERASRPRALRLFLALLLVLGGLYAIERMYGAQLREQYSPQLAQLFHQTYNSLAQKLHSLTRSSSGSSTGASTVSAEKQETAAVASGDDHNADPMSSTTSPSEESLRSSPSANAAPAAAAPDAGDSETASGPASAPPPAASPAASSAPLASAPATPPATATPPPAPATTGTPRGALLAGSRNEPRAGRRGSEPTDGGDFTRASGRFNPAEIPVNVPPNVMQENLITSRVPAYPQTAKAEGIEGQVVMQAIISKDGTVDQVHVIQGDPLLRTAASEAVSRWHYRPYTVNGRPVDVATIVKVEFKLPRRY